MNRFMVFSGESYYPCGGWEDFKGSFATVEEAQHLCVKLKADWCHYVDIETASVTWYWQSTGFDTKTLNEHYEEANRVERERRQALADRLRP